MGSMTVPGTIVFIRTINETACIVVVAIAHCNYSVHPFGIVRGQIHKFEPNVPQSQTREKWIPEF